MAAWLQQQVWGDHMATQPDKVAMQPPLSSIEGGHTTTFFFFISKKLALPLLVRSQNKHVQYLFL
jgi:hypothetical protein